MFFQINLVKVLQLKDQLLSFLNEFEFNEEQIQALQKDFEKWVLIRHKFRIYHTIPEEQPFDDKTRREYLERFEDYDISDNLLAEMKNSLLIGVGKYLRKLRKYLKILSTTRHTKLSVGLRSGLMTLILMNA